MPIRVLVTGGTGKIGTRLVANLREMGHEAVPAARHVGGDGITLDLRDADQVRKAAEGFDAVFLNTPLGPDEGEVGVAAVNAVRAAGVGKPVYLAIHNLEAMQAIPHFATKIPVKQAVLEQKGSVVLQPNFFYQNDLTAMPAISGPGIYPLPVGDVGVWSIDVGDIARAAARALTFAEWDGKAVPLCGPERLTGPGMAQVWTEALGTKVHYGGDDVEPFVALMRANVPDMTDWMANDFKVLMEVTQEKGCVASPDDISASEAIVGQPLTRYADFVAATIMKEMNQ